MQKQENKTGCLPEAANQVEFVMGSWDTVFEMEQIPLLEPFSETVLGLLEEVSRSLRENTAAREYPDVIAFAFWIRRANLLLLKDRFCKKEADRIICARGTAFHIAPSNVAVNYAYSLVSGLLCGNPEIVRISSKEFVQVDLINDTFAQILRNHYPKLFPYLCLVRYGHEQQINDLFSGLADIRVIWGGDRTIAEIRKSPIKPRTTEITFADRFSFTVIDADAYLLAEQKEILAHRFYNDTYLSDQKACTSPRLVVWTGNHRQEARLQFWELLHQEVQKNYTLMPVQAVDKLNFFYLLSGYLSEYELVPMKDNLIMRIRLATVLGGLQEHKCSNGCFFEYDCENLLELRELCDRSEVQTISYIGDPSMFEPLLKSGIRGIDRIVPIGMTMDFDLIWDGCDLFERMTRVIDLKQENSDTRSQPADSRNNEIQIVHERTT